ncbi:MAG TPA: thioredoxin [Coleofasciculaceae cyanobacterium]
MSNSTSVLTLTDSNFHSEVLTSSQPVLVDFWAPWCGPCRLITPIIEAVAVDFMGQVKVGKLNTDQFDHLATQYGIHAIPTLLIFQNGQVVDEIVGVVAKADLAAKLNTILGQPQRTPQVA